MFPIFFAHRDVLLDLEGLWNSSKSNCTIYVYTTYFIGHFVYLYKNMIMIINCVICESPFEGTRQDQKCCSRECKLKYRTKKREHRVQIDFTCVICGDVFVQRRKDKITCSASCTQKLWIKNNPEKDKNRNCGNDAKIRRKQWIKNNYERFREIQNRYKNKKRKNDLIYKLKYSISNLIRDSFKNKNYKKKSRTTEILGCSCESFKLYLELKFESWMTWENYGLWNGELNNGWDIDHIIPVSSGNSEEEIIRLNHYSNFQPLCSHKNRYIKRNHLNYLEIK